MMWQLDIPGYRKPPLSLNTKTHWAPQHRLRVDLMDAVIWTAKALKLPRHLERVSVELHYRPASRRRRDEDNLAPTLKACCDALVLYGLVPDDSHEYLTSASRIDPVNSMKPGLYLLITDLSAVSGLIKENPTQ